jgi:hypothetical protein
MALSTTVNKVIYTGNGFVNTYSVNFPFQQNTDLVVKVRDDLGLVTTTLILNQDYFVSGANNILGGSISLQDLGQDYLVSGNLRTDYKILIARRPAIVQQTDFRNAGRFFAETHEDQFDRQTYYDQILKEVVDRGIYFDEFSSSLVGELPTPQNGQYLAWDGTTGKLKNANTTIDPLLLSAIDMTYDNSTSTLTSVNVQGAIDELDVKSESSISRLDLLEPRVDTAEANITTLDTSVSTLQSLVDSLFPVGKFDMTLTPLVPPNPLNWLALNMDHTLSRTGAYENLYNYLVNNFLIVDEGTFDWESFYAYRPTADSTVFVIRRFNAMSPRGQGNNVLNSNTKIGPSLGRFQEDQMQRITGRALHRFSSGAVPAFEGVLSADSLSNQRATITTVTNNSFDNLRFDSISSPSARVSLTTDGETRGNSFPVTYWIRY